MNIHMTVIEHDQQFYPTVGDWIFDDGDLHVMVSRMAEDYTFLVAIHEMIEAYLCYKRGIAEEVVTQFDSDFIGIGEPGDSPDAPYREEHFFATTIERLIAAELGVDWEAYDEAVREL